jgi:hypothetical protein
MCAFKKTDVRESPNNSTPTGGEGQGSHGETFHLIYGESPVSSVAEHPLCNTCQPQISCLNTYWEMYNIERVIKTFTIMNVINFRYIEPTASMSSKWKTTNS